MSAVVVPEALSVELEAWTEGIRRELGRSPGDTLHFQNLKKHGERLHVAQSIGTQKIFRIITVVVCKEYLAQTRRLNDDQAYLYTFRYLLERISWYARDSRCDVRYTLAHIHRFKIAKLRQYEAALRTNPECSVAWDWVDPAGGAIDQPNRVTGLQVADLAVSAIAQAFEPDRFGNTEPRYLTELLPRVWRRGSGDNRLTTYGLKMHPWSPATKAAYPWVATL